MSLDATLPKDAVLVTCTAPVNIAVVKYWGKRDSKLILPTNSSLSGTIHQGSMRSKTTIIASKTFEKDEMTLNGKVENVEGSKRLSAVLNALRARAGDFVSDEGTVLIAKADWPQYKLRIISENNFPTAAGLASSASGFACFTKCLATVFNVAEDFEGDLSSIARQGSGSACRSLYGGWVKWEQGVKTDGSDSYAVQVADEHHWPEMRVLILVAHGGQKEVPSTSGMETTVQTSALLQHRIKHVVPERMERMEKAILAKDFASFAAETMQDSNQFHAVCLDTYPPIFYMNAASKKIIHVVHTLNALAAAAGKPPVAAYTYDAGPNAVLYLLEENMEQVLALVTEMFKPETAGADWAADPMALSYVGKKAAAPAVPAEWTAALGSLETRADEKVYNLFVSSVGPGPIVEEKKNSF
jgi:diphosphomevalonate decarboxylase